MLLDDVIAVGEVFGLSWDPCNLAAALLSADDIIFGEFVQVVPSSSPVSVSAG